MKAVRVRIAVAVDKDGNWGAYGGNSASDVSAMDIACEHLHPGETRYWLEATLEVPEEKTIEADVVKSEEKPWCIY